jgi:SRSO17 transposase
MAARLAPDKVRRRHQSLHHLVADAPWNDEERLAEVQRYVLPSMQKHGPGVAWSVEDTGFPKQGKHWVGWLGSTAVSGGNRIAARRR